MEIRINHIYRRVENVNIKYEKWGKALQHFICFKFVSKVCIKKLIARGIFFFYRYL